mgnify:CR=1 FL=1
MKQLWDRGYVHVYTGNGKGKTTAAIGLAVRAAGAGLKVYIGQFVKGRPYSEIGALERFKDLITVRQFGRGCFIYDEPADEDIRLAEEGMAESRKAVMESRYALVILDEACVAAKLGLLAGEDLVGLAALKAPQTELVFTGRDASSQLVAEADLVTEMSEVKHYFASGVQARTGIES